MLTAQHFSKYVMRPHTELAEAPLWAGTPLLGTDVLTNLSPLCISVGS